MSFWAVMSACFAPTQDTPPLRPTLTIQLNNTWVSALFDTGSSVSLVDEKFKNDILLKGTNAATSPSVRLCGANGKELQQSGCYSIKVTLGKRHVFHNLIFIKDLQVPCILGMDFMAYQNVVIDASKRVIKFAAKKQTNSVSTLSGTKAIHLSPHSETAISIPVPFPFVQGLIESGPSLPDKVMVMDGVTSSYYPPDSPADPVCNVIVANFSHLPIKIPTNTPLALLTTDPRLNAKPLSACLSISTEKPRIINTSHVEKLDLSHIPTRFQQHYLSLLCSYADVFSKNDLDVGHCKSLPHQVRLTDPNKITSINQYRLPHHLKEVAIDYVERLLAARVVRKSNSVFNSPLMLVKKPHANPAKPLSEQYRLVHNYVELNKNIALCSYPLRHLYELLDDVASGTVFSVLDLSQGFFQQHLTDP